MVSVVSFGMYLLTFISLKKIGVISIILISLFLLSVTRSHAATLTGAKDTVTTSRPSASSPNNNTAPSNAPATSSQLTIYNNGSRFLASDSAKVIKNTGIVTNTNLIIASQSSALSTLFLGNTTSATIYNGADVVFVPITAMHAVQFTSAQNLDTGDDIVITFPTLASGDANNPASPSASTFQLNNIASAQIQIEDDGAAFAGTFTATVTNPTAGSSPIISLNIDSSSIAPGSVVKIYLGCTAQSGTACTTQAPRIINPTKNSSTTCSGTPETCTATSYKVGIQAIDSATSNTDSATVGIGIVESVTVRATVDPTLSFTITGIANATAINTSNAGCSQDETTNSGITGTANEINLGLLANTPAIDVKVANISGQRINISTNGATGYALTATSSSSLLNPETGFFLHASTTPASFPVTNDFFGLHACGQDAVTGFSEAGASSSDCDTHATGSSANECQYAWPTSTNQINTTPLSISLDTTGPIGAGSADASGDGVTSISYAAGIDVAVPPGEYRAIVTYIATPSF